MGNDVDNTSTMFLHPGMVHWEGERGERGGEGGGGGGGGAFYNLSCECLQCSMDC